MDVMTYTRRASTVINPITGLHNLQQWHISPDGTVGWHGIPGLWLPEEEVKSAREKLLRRNA